MLAKLVELAEGLPRHASLESCDTLEWIGFLCHRPTTEADAGVDHSLEGLCRKIDVSHRLVRKYEPFWGKPLDTSPVAARSLVAAAVGFARHAAAPITSRARALKYLNAAFNALDLGRSQAQASEAECVGVALLAILETRSGHALD